MQILQQAQDILRPGTADKAAEDSGSIFNRQRLASMVGVAAILLPVVLFVSTLFGSAFYQSISHFYYSKYLGTFFVGVLATVGALMLAYKGENKWQTRLAITGGGMTWLVAFFPTKGAGCNGCGELIGRAFGIFSEVPGGTGMYSYSKEQGPGPTFTLFEYAGIIHYGSAFALFCILALFTFFIFTIVRDFHYEDDGKTLKWEKRVRNRIYNICGSLILFSIVMMMLYSFNNVAWESWWNSRKLTFCFEALALMAFGFSWLVKGRFLFGYLENARDKRAREQNAWQCSYFVLYCLHLIWLEGMASVSVLGSG